MSDEKTNESEKLVSKADKSISATSTITDYLNDKIVIANEYAEKNLPAPVAKSVSAIYSVLEETRQAGKLWADDKSAELNKKIVALSKGEVAGVSISKEKTSDTFEKPLTYAYAFGADIISAVFGNKLFFYSGLLIMLLFVIRFIKRVFFF